MSSEWVPPWKYFLFFNYRFFKINFSNEYLLSALTSRKVEELYESLSKKSAEIYIDRSKKLYATVPIRTKLFTWQLTNLEIVALADPSIHGKDNVIKNMKEIDPDRSELIIQLK